MTKAFEPTTIRGIPLRNRFVRSATWEGLADSGGLVRDELIEMLSRLAENEVGLIIPGFAYVQAQGRAMPFQTGIDRDETIDGLKRLVESVHEAGGRIFIQIAHGGVASRPGAGGNDVPPGPSAIELPKGKVKPRELGTVEIQGIVDDFGRAAGRAIAAGCDGVQLHAAHGYLLSQFLSPFYNRRGDRYGGKAHNRARLLCEVFEAVRGEVGDKAAVTVKINSEDYLAGGLELNESLEAARNLDAMGIDAIEVSGGLPYSGVLNPIRAGIDAPEKEAYFRLAAQSFKAAVKAPVILVGGLRSPSVISEILDQDHADLVALCRPLIREPDLIDKWRTPDAKPSACISCGACAARGVRGKGVSCAVLARENKDE